MDASRIPDASRRKRRALAACAAAAIAIASAALLAPVIRQRQMLAAFNDPAIGWSGVPRALDDAAATPAYARAGDLLAHPERIVGGMPDEARQRRACGFRLMVDTLRSLTPAQAAVLDAHRVLPYQDLDATQRRRLDDLARITRPGRPRVDPAPSFLGVIASRDDRTAFAAAWMTPTDRAGEAGVILEVHFPVDDVVPGRGASAVR